MDLTKTKIKKISTVSTFSQSAEIVKATRQWKSITIHEIDAICSGLSSTRIGVLLVGARVVVVAYHDIQHQPVDENRHERDSGSN